MQKLTWNRGPAAQLDEQEPIFLTREEVDDLHYEAIERYGGHHGVLNEHLAESAINQATEIGLRDFPL